MGMHAFPVLPLGEGVLDRFGRIRIKDGTRFDLDPAHGGHFAGFGGKCSSSSGMCVQFEYDLKAQSILEVGLTPANVPDGKNSGTFTVDILPDDLILRDLGYFNLAAIENHRQWRLFDHQTEHLGEALHPGRGRGLPGL